MTSARDVGRGNLGNGPKASPTLTGTLITPPRPVNVWMVRYRTDVAGVRSREVEQRIVLTVGDSISEVRAAIGMPVHLLGADWRGTAMAPRLA